jgi:hypothetical protein
MTNFYLGETIMFTGTYTDSAAREVDPDTDTVKINVYDPNGVLKVTQGVPTKRTNSTSTYDYWYDIPDDATPGVWVHEWFGSVTTPQKTWKVVERKEVLVQTPVISDP